MRMVTLLMVMSARVIVVALMSFNDGVGDARALRMMPFLVAVVVMVT